MAARARKKKRKVTKLKGKAGKKFPDLTGDGKVTFADILKGRGVGKKKKKGRNNALYKSTPKENVR